MLAGMASPQTPSEAVFELRAIRTPAVYQIGERIDLELSFSAPVSGKYGINSTSERRDSSLLNEIYSVSPAAGAIDPQQHEQALPWGFGGSFMSAQGALAEKPIIRHADLNEWLRFTRPGHYLLRAVSPRVFPVGEADPLLGPAAGNHPVQSNEIELTIVDADNAWSASQLADITAILDSDEKEEVKLQAARRLGYLDTPEAVAEMARRYSQSVTGSQSDWEWFKAISQSCHADAAIPIFRARLVDTHAAHPESIIQLLARLVIEQEYRGKPLPPCTEHDAQKLRVFQEAVSERQKRYNDLVAQYFAELLASLPRRSGKERANALFALWQDQESRSPEDVSAIPELIRLRAGVIASIDDLSRGQQRSILDFSWKRLGNKSLLPFIRRVATEAAEDNDAGLREIALKRWCDLDPEECEGAVIAEIKNRNTRLQVSTLLILPAGEKPALDAILAARLADSKTDTVEAQRTAALIERYASKALATQVREYMAGPQQGPIEICEISSHLLAYLLRVNEKTAVPLVAGALARRGPSTGCYRTLLTSVADLHYVAPLSDLAEAAVRGDSSPEVAGNAALLLSAYGPASAEGAIWERLVAWSKKWAGREEDLRYRPLASDLFQGERTFEDNFAFALGNAKAWTLSPGDYNWLSRLCVTQNCRNNVKNWSERR
jgi:hypothetical protein